MWRDIAVGIIVAVVLGAGGLLWNWGTKGWLIRALGGVTFEQVDRRIRTLEDQVQKLTVDIAQLPTKHASLR
jgi:hypothetical protein